MAQIRGVRLKNGKRLTPFSILILRETINHELQPASAWNSKERLTRTLPFVGLGKIHVIIVSRLHRIIVSSWIEEEIREEEEAEKGVSHFR